jgi:hypothetical protein
VVARWIELVRVLSGAIFECSDGPLGVVWAWRAGEALCFLGGFFHEMALREFESLKSRLDFNPNFWLTEDILGAR